MKVQRIKDHDLLTWEECDMKDIRKGDVFYTTNNGLKGPLLIADDSAQQMPHSKHRYRMAWSVKTKPF